MIDEKTGRWKECHLGELGFRYDFETGSLGHVYGGKVVYNTESVLDQLIRCLTLAK